MLVLSSVHWREAWKYGVRAWRYSVLDAGHVVGALALAASSLGWQCSVLEHDGLLADTGILEGLTGLGADSWEHVPRTEREDGIVALLIRPRASGGAGDLPSIEQLQRLCGGAATKPL